MAAGAPGARPTTQEAMHHAYVGASIELLDNVERDLVSLEFDQEAVVLRRVAESLSSLRRSAAFLGHQQVARLSSVGVTVVRQSLQTSRPGRTTDLAAGLLGLVDALRARLLSGATTSSPDDALDARVIAEAQALCGYQAPGDEEGSPRRADE